MTSVYVLILALVCSTPGTIMERTADHNHNSSMANHVENLTIPRKIHANAMETSRTNINDSTVDTFDNNNHKVHRTEPKYVEFDEIYTENNIVESKTLDKEDLKKYFLNGTGMEFVRSKRQVDDSDPCEPFMYTNKDQTLISHPHGKFGSNFYTPSMDCVTEINADPGQVIQLTFIDFFHIEEHADCAYDYLEVRDGQRGYAKLIDKVCGKAFPPQMVTSGPNAWLKFHSDDTIEYEGFHINVKILESSTSHNIPKPCYEKLGGTHGVIDSEKITACKEQSQNQALDMLWEIEVEKDMKIYLNFTSYNLATPNECEENVIQVFGDVLEFQAKLAHYCGSMANAVTTKGPKGHIMYVRLFTSQAGKKSTFSATYTAFRTLDPSKDEKCSETEFDCEDNTCIDGSLKCDRYAHCRLKADEDYDLCKGETESMISQPHIMVILVIFSLILSGMSFVFLFKCIRKLYQDHKIIKEHIKQSCEDRLDRLDSLMASRMTLDANKLQRDSEPRASLERENQTNEMFKKQRSFSHRKPTSIDSDFIQETHLDLDEPWQRQDSIPVLPENVRIERNGRKRSDISKREESIKSKQEKEVVEKKEIRDVAVGAPDTKESGCQTRESLFQAETAPSSDGSGSNSRGFSTFGYSGGTIARPSPVPANTSEITIELTKQPSQDSYKSKKKIPDRRPMSTETTRSAPDVIIVSKPIR